MWTSVSPCRSSLLFRRGSSLSSHPPPPPRVSSVPHVRPRSLPPRSRWSYIPSLYMLLPLGRHIDTARHVIDTRVNPRLLCYMARPEQGPVK